MENQEMQKIFGTTLQTSQGEILVKELRTVDVLEFLKDWKSLAEAFSFGGLQAIFQKALPKIINKPEVAQLLYMSEIDKIETIFRRINLPFFRHSEWAIKSALQYGMGEILQELANVATRDLCGGIRNLNLKEILSGQPPDNLSEQESKLNEGGNTQKQRGSSTTTTESDQSAKIQVKLPHKGSTD
jgi:hypothetical protein